MGEAGEDEEDKGSNDKRTIWQEDQVINVRNDKGQNARGRNGRGRSGHKPLLWYSSINLHFFFTW